MLKQIEEKNYDLYNFYPFQEYMNQFNDDLVEIIYLEDKYDTLQIKFKINSKYYRILIYKDKEKEWATIEQFKDENFEQNFEQIEFMCFNRNYFKYDEYDAIIKYSSILTDDKFARVIRSVYSYKNNKMLPSFEQKRKFEVSEVDKVYKQHMNLTELILWTDKNVHEFYEVIDLKNEEIKKLKLYY